MIRFDNVTKKFAGQVSALSEITVEIKDGEFVFLIGPSGAGKTTFLRLIIRDMVASTGSIHVDELDIGKMAASEVYLLRRKVGTVFQDFKLLTDRTVYENVALGLEILGKSPSETHRRVTDILGLVGLADKRNHFPIQLSAGEMQRTGIARAIVGGPSILLADEPTGNLDPQTAWDIIDILREIQKIGTTVVMATHNVNIVNDMRQRTITLERGRLIRDEEKGKYHEAGRSKGRKDHASH